jgi:hypothetical protein
MLMNIVGALLKYLCVSMSLFMIFGLIVLDDDSKWYEWIFLMLFMPFIVVLGFGSAIIEDIRDKIRR